MLVLWLCCAVLCCACVENVELTSFPPPLPGSDGWVDGAVDCVGFEARGNGAASAGEVPAQVLNDCMDIVREGGSIGIPVNRL